MWRIFTYRCTNEHFATMPSQRYLSRTASTRQPSHLELFELDSPVNITHSDRENSIPHHILGEAHFAGGLPNCVSRYHKCGKHQTLRVGGDTAWQWSITASLAGAAPGTPAPTKHQDWPTSRLREGPRRGQHRRVYYSRSNRAPRLALADSRRSVSLRCIPLRRSGGPPRRSIPMRRSTATGTLETRR
jgi:hypothetical protein